MNMSHSPAAPATTPRATDAVAPSACVSAHDPYDCGEAMPAGTVADILRTHGVFTTTATDGTLLAWEAATQRTVRGIVDVSEWVVAPADACALAAWLGY
jgi:hypothetical protein